MTTHKGTPYQGLGCPILETNHYHERPLGAAGRETMGVDTSKQAIVEDEGM